MVSAASEASIRRELYRTRAPQKAGRIRWPIANTMVDRNPTVSAWRGAAQQPPVCQSHKERKARVHTSRLGGPDRGFGNVKCEHGGQSREREQSREPREPAGELRQNCRPGETKSDKQEPRPWLVQSQKYGQPACVESPHGGNQEPPRRECHQTLVRHVRECGPCVAYRNLEGRKEVHYQRYQKTERRADYHQHPGLRSTMGCGTLAGRRRRPMSGDGLEEQQKRRQLQDRRERQ